ncbi:MAG: NAD(P)-binding protein [Thermoanaerobaculia bacterium]|nr:NAD(P)-binding protein [Thermoanaerobaculia bacterium]
MSATTKKKIAILGGGMASLSAAHELTDYDGWQDQYEITIYQLGWRLGGKTATGRGRGNRIEEHGIHILQGWYETTFRLLRALYDERKRRGLAPNSPLQDLFSDGLQRNNSTLLTEYYPHLGKWVNWPMIFPELEELPGAGGPLPAWELLRKGMAIMLEMLLGSPYAKDLNPFSRWLLDHFFPADGQQPAGCLASLFSKIGLNKAGGLPDAFHALREAQTLSGQAPADGHHAHHTLILNALGKFVERIGDRAENIKEPGQRHLLMMILLTYYNLKGILADVYDPDTGQLDFRRINDLDYREWLQKHGTPHWLRYSVIVRFFYTGTFSNLTNDTGGAIAAGSALQFLLASLGYKGSFVFQFRYGTGDTMVMPMYEVLRSRGVQFKFFQKVEQVNYSATGSIETIGIAEQVRLIVPQYDPVKTVGHLNTWPAEPNYTQIDPEQAAKLQAGQINLENPWADWPDYRQYTLQKGIDFDEIILGIPVGALKTICSDICRHDERWRQMTEQVQTTPTQSAQLWFLPSLEELGFRQEDWGLADQNCAANVVLYQNPMYSWLDSSLVLPNEDWPAAQKPKFLAYFTGPYVLNNPLPPFSDHGYHEREMHRLINAFEQWLFDNAAWFWPNGAYFQYPNGLNFSLLADPDQHTNYRKRLEQQFFRANVAPTDHFTLSVPKSERYRFKTDGSGYDNLFLCGDWIDFGMNVGYIDGTIQSGLQAAQALRAKLQLDGHKPLWGAFA